MSFLADMIKDIIRIAGNGTVGTVSNEIDKFKDQLGKQLKILEASKDLRVYDKTNGGALRGPIKSRKKYESNGKLLCDIGYMTYGSGGVPSEVPYMRALFNGRIMDAYKIIAYETPLMRKKEKNINEDISGREVSCDLMGIKGNELCCIEVKTVPDKPATNLPYALLEGFAYATCLNWLLKNKNYSNEINNEVELCCKTFGLHPPSQSVSKATFAIAAPKDDYFKPYAIEKMAGHSPEWFKRRKNEAGLIQKAILKNYKDLFAGYIVVSCSVRDCGWNKTNKANIVEPIFNKKNDFTHYKSMAEIWDALK
jgi:hypothetical protein